MANPNRNPELFAYLGEDEFGSGEVGLKQSLTPAGYIPLVAIASHRPKIDNPRYHMGMQILANSYGNTIRLVRYVPVEEVLVISPSKH